MIPAQSAHPDLRRRKASLRIRLAPGLGLRSIHQLLAKKKDIQLMFSPQNIPPLMLDKNAMIQAIGNFIGNAIKFSPHGRLVKISTECEEEVVRLGKEDPSRTIIAFSPPRKEWMLEWIKLPHFAVASDAMGKEGKWMPCGGHSAMR